MSFRDRVTFSMIASRERQHSERVPKLVKYQTRILPIAVLYGGNASGKTNFFQALNFARNLVTKGQRPDSLIPVQPFLLDTDVIGRPSRFEFVLLIEDTIYEFSFAVTRNAVLEEKLVVINSTSEKVLYDRQGETPHFNGPLARNQSLKYAFQGTRDNQLFLTNSVSQKINEFRTVFDWFDEKLVLIAPDSRFNNFHLLFHSEHPATAAANEVLIQLDSGIVRLGQEEIPFDSMSIPESLRTELQEEVKEGEGAQLLDSLGEERFVVFRQNGELNAKKLVTYHLKKDGTEVKFDIRQESDGTKRMIELLPAFLGFDARESDSVFVIDEVDRSLHTMLVRSLVENYLSGSSTKSRSQMLLTTHDVQLMDQQLLRRDEMWATERDVTGSSNLFPFSDYKDIRYDKDIRKSYLQGRLGGIPHIVSGNIFSDPDLVSDSIGKN